MKYSFVGVIIWGIVLLIGLAVIASFITLLFFGIKALKKYLNTKEVREECKMTQEFVAEAIGVSRQAVSKWENGTSDPSTSN